MKKWTFIFTALIVALIAVPAMAMQGHDSHGSGSGSEMKSEKNVDHSAHGKQNDHTGMGGTFKHSASHGRASTRSFRS